jgi:hypothetical protein
VSVIEEERTMEASSTDKRIDDLSGRVGRFEDRFERFEDKVDARFERVDARFDRLDERFDRWGRIVVGGVVAVAASVIAKILGA